MKIAIIDLIGIPYDGTTRQRQGLGGSESAVSLAALELALLGFTVTVYNNCVDHAEPGVYSGVRYKLWTEAVDDPPPDILISSRTVIPFLDRNEDLADPRWFEWRSQNFPWWAAQARLRVLWMHDTFCLGDQFIETLCQQGHIDQVFVLSDWHLSYVTTCSHGPRRNFEVLKDRMFVTRNGCAMDPPDLDPRHKDYDHYVYNASVTKGMIPLIKEIWPRIHSLVPQARLTVIGGYYRFRESAVPDQQEQQWREFSRDPALSAQNITFTGVIPQHEIYAILKDAAWTIYPAAFPETYGISTTESLAALTPVLTCKFGALEEIALEASSYTIDYAIEPNSLFPEINHEQQVTKFVEMVLAARANPRLWLQKAHAARQIWPTMSWRSVVLQWTQQFYHLLGHYLSRKTYRECQQINHQVHRIYGRRWTNPVAQAQPKLGHEQPIVVISTGRNGADYVQRCIHSTAGQDYLNWQHVLIDDASTDDTLAVIDQTLDQLPPDIRKHYQVISHRQRRGAPRNHVEFCRSVPANAIVMLLDSDDCLVNRNDIFDYYNNLYDQGCEFSYGSCRSLADDIDLIAQEYPLSVKQSRSYRQYQFEWGLPYTHLRTFRAGLLQGIPDSQFQNAQGQWWMAGGDVSVFYALIERADPQQVRAVQEIMVMYNDLNPQNDYKVNSQEQTLAARTITNEKNTNSHTHST